MEKSERRDEIGDWLNGVPLRTATFYGVMDNAGPKYSPGALNYLQKVKKGHIEPLPQGTKVKLQTAEFEGIGFAHGISSAFSIEWRRPIEDSDITALLFVLRGQGEVITDGRMVKREPGAVMVLPGTEPAKMQLTGTVNEFIEVNFHSHRFAGSIATVDEKAKNLPPIDMKTLKPFFAFISNTCNSSRTTQKNDRALEMTADAVTAGLLAASFGQGEDWLSSLLTKVYAFVVSHYADPNIRVDDAAADIGVSVRYLQQELNKSGKKFSCILRDIRVDRVRDLKTSRPDISAAELAKLSGFGSLSAMYRALRANEDKTN